MTSQSTIKMLGKWLRLGIPLLMASFLLLVILLSIQNNEQLVHADPIDPPQGYPKLDVSVKTVTPTLAATGGETLFYTIEIRNTGAYTAQNTTLTDPIPANTTYNGDAQSSVSPAPIYSANTLTWQGDVGFDATVIISFSVDVEPSFVGTVQNTAVISHSLITEPISLTAETTVTDDPILAIEKTAVPPMPGANKPLTYTIVVANQGQPAINLPITVTDEVPLNTTVRSVGPDGSAGGGVVTWLRNVTLDLGETTVFTYSVDVGDVPSGTVITNDTYQVESPLSGITAGEVYTVTIVDPIFSLSKSIWPDPPGSNREMTYTLTLFNQGSLATGLVITDVVPAGVTYVRGGTEAGGEVSWYWPSLDTNESAEFTYTVYISDVAEVDVTNSDYAVCSAEDVCQAGKVLTSTIQGATFETFVFLDPIAKKPGGGGGPVTPTITIENLGPGNALDATALFKFERISVSLTDLYATPAVGVLSTGPDCGEKCDSFIWVGDLAYGEVVTFTTVDGQSTIGGEEGTLYTATVVITDSLSNITTEPVTGTATGKVTHFANLIPIKSAPAVIGRGQLMTYTLTVWNSALSTDSPPLPWLWDYVPISTTVVSISDGGITQTISGTTVVSWTLPALSTGDTVARSFTVQVNDDLVSGTQLINNYEVFWYEDQIPGITSTVGQPVTTTVQEIGLIDSFKEVTPTVALPGPGNVFTFYVHVVNSSAFDLNNITVYDDLPWESSTYQRDAVASAGAIISDIVSVQWAGDVAAFSSEVITLSVEVDPDYQGAITNTAVISHPNLLNEVMVKAVAYVTDQPVLEINKSATPDPAEAEAELVYTIRVVNLGQQATNLVVTDTIPADTTYVANSASAGGHLAGDQVRWEIPVLDSGASSTFFFAVTVGNVDTIVNDRYGVRAAGGVVSLGTPLVTSVIGSDKMVYIPLVIK